MLLISESAASPPQYKKTLVSSANITDFNNDDVLCMSFMQSMKSIDHIDFCKVYKWNGSHNIILFFAENKWPEL